ncbi:MAG: homocysteine S-methyltransferase family protein [Methylocystis sp.]
MFLTGGGNETSLILLYKLEPPFFAAFHLLRNEAGRSTLIRYYERYLAIAEADRRSVELIREARTRCASQSVPIVIRGCAGSCGDGYDPTELMFPAEVEAYYAPKIDSFAEAGADMATAVTVINVAEAIAIARAAAKAELPSAISFTLETYGMLSTEQSLAVVLSEVEAATLGAPAYYMINCARPSHFQGAIPADEPWTRRIRGLRANTSPRGHKELNEAPLGRAWRPEI